MAKGVKVKIYNIFQTSKPNRFNICKDKLGWRRPSVTMYVSVKITKVSRNLRLLKLANPYGLLLS